MLSEGSEALRDSAENLHLFFTPLIYRARLPRMTVIKGFGAMIHWTALVPACGFGTFIFRSQ
jgi:hypothetical protein